MELVFALSLGMLLFLWLANYLNVFYASSEQSLSHSQAQIAVKNLALLANRACASQVSIETNLPCIMQGAQPQLYAIQKKGVSGDDAKTLEIVFFESQPSVAASAKALCEINPSTIAGLYVSCNPADYANSLKLCISPSLIMPNEVELKFGSCE